MNTNPATVGKDVMGFGAASGNQLIADVFRKGNVYQAVAMYVADFPSSQTVFRTSKPMRMGGDPGPALHRAVDPFFCPRNSHKFPL